MQGCVGTAKQLFKQLAALQLPDLSVEASGVATTSQAPAAPAQQQTANPPAAPSSQSQQPHNPVTSSSAANDAEDDWELSEPILLSGQRPASTPPPAVPTRQATPPPQPATTKAPGTQSSAPSSRPQSRPRQTVDSSPAPSRSGPATALEDDLPEAGEHTQTMCGLYN